jgi:hypothetical protein
MSEVLTRLRLPETWKGARHALTSVPWPAEREDVPRARAVGVESQAVALFEPKLTPRLRRFLLLVHAAGGLPGEVEIVGDRKKITGESPVPLEPISNVELAVIRENLDRHANSYVYSERGATILVGNREIGLTLGLLPNTSTAESVDDYSWWQWTRAERMWSGELAEAWRIGGHLVPYTPDAPGKWTSPDLTELGELLNQYCGDVLHGDLFLIVWRSGMIQVTAHFKSAYFHTFPKPVPAFPVIYLHGVTYDEMDVRPCGLMMGGRPNRISERGDNGDPAIESTVFQPWNDLRLLANKDRDNKLIYLPPGQSDILPAGVSRSIWFNIPPEGTLEPVARYQVPAGWYRQCGQLETENAGPAAQMAARCAEAIRASTETGGIDTGRVWRYLRRWEKLNKPQEDGAEWEGNLAQAMFTLAYQRQEPPDQWEIYLHQAYHAADVSVYHGSWMGRLECTAAFSAPLPKFRFGGLVYGYLETGDPYLLEVARSLAGVYMAMEWALEPRSAIGRDAYPLSCLMALWDYSADSLYLDFARQTATRLIATQEPDGGFSGQAGAGVLTGVSAKPGVRDIHFGSGILSPIALLEWATRDSRWPAEFLPALRKWADLMLSLQKEDGHWYVEGKSDEPYTLTGSGTLFSLVKAGEILKDRRCIAAVERYLRAMNEKNAYVLGTHAFLSAQYAHVADAALNEQTST